MEVVQQIVPARDGYPLGASIFNRAKGGEVVLISAAMATPANFYKQFATGLAELGFTVVAQSGYWRLMGGWQPLPVAFHGFVTLPLLPRLVGYMPFSKFGFGEDVPGPAAIQWGRWVRNPLYLLGDASLPLQRFKEFRAPVLAYSIDDDNWGSARAVDALMRAYPNLERRHLIPGDYGMAKIGHFGAFRSGAEAIWDEMAQWLGQR